MNDKNLSHSAFKALARSHQINFKTSAKEEGGLGIERFPERIIHRKNKSGEVTEYKIPVESSLCWEDTKDSAGNYVIFYEGFRKQISDEIKRRMMKEKSKADSKYSCSQMLTNLLRSEHIPYNVFFPMRLYDNETVALFNDLLGTDRIESITDIKIEYAPVKTDTESSKEIPLLGDGTAFDVYIEYILKNSQPGAKGGIGIEVKYTEKEYHLKPESKEFQETHDAKGIHLADNYRKPSYDIGWFKTEYLLDIPKDDIHKSRTHFVADK